MDRFRTAWLGWAGVGSLGLWFLNTFGPGLLPAPIQLAALVMGVLLLLAYLGVKQVRWLTQNTPATATHVGLIFGLELAVFGVVAMDVGSRIDLLPRTIPTARQVATEMGGGDNFCYFRATLNDPQPDGGYEWKLINKQQRPIPNMEMHRYQIIDGESQYRGHWEPATCVTDSVNQTTANEDPIMPGKHYFKFQSINSWEQSLEITGGKEPKQIGVIYRDGKEIWRFPDEPR